MSNINIKDDLSVFLDLWGFVKVSDPQSIGHVLFPSLGMGRGFEFNMPFDFSEVEDLDLLKMMVASKLDGVRVALISDGNSMVLYDRSKNYYVTERVIPDFTGSCFDCEVVGNKIFVIDVISWKGLTNQPFALRYQYLLNLIRLKSDQYSVQKYIPYGMFRNSGLEYTEGLVFARLDKKYNETMSIFKWKPMHKDSFDLSVKAGEIIDACGKKLGFSDMDDGIYEFSLEGVIVGKRLKMTCDSIDNVDFRLRKSIEYDNLRKIPLLRYTYSFDIVENIRKNNKKHVIEVVNVVEETCVSEESSNKQEGGNTEINVCIPEGKVYVTERVLLSPSYAGKGDNTSSSLSKEREHNKREISYVRNKHAEARYIRSPQSSFLKRRGTINISNNGYVKPRPFEPGGKSESPSNMSNYEGRGNSNLRRGHYASTSTSVSRRGGKVKNNRYKSGRSVGRGDEILPFAPT